MTNVQVGLPDNVIYIGGIFNPVLKQGCARELSQIGLENAIEKMLSQGFKYSVTKVYLTSLLREYGW